MMRLSNLVLTVPAPCNQERIDPDSVSSPFDRVLRDRWRAAAESGVCRYRLTTLETKILPGKYRFVAQLNTSRALQRRTPQHLHAVSMAFDPDQFNFNRVQEREVLMSLHMEGEPEGGDHAIIINVSPLEFGNSLLVPSVSRNIPQRVTLQGLELLIRVMLSSTDPGFRAGFNSPGGYASVNHQHYHLYYLQERLHLETIDVEHVQGPCYTLKDFPSKGFAFQLEKDPSLLARNVYKLVDYLRDNEIAHNLFATRGQSFCNSSSDAYDTLRIFVWARESTFGVKQESCFNPALCEIAGHLLIKEAGTYETVTEEAVVSMLEAVTADWYKKVFLRIPELYPLVQEAT